MFTLFSFYRSKEWAEFRRVVIAERTREDGFVYDEVTGKPILKPYDLILHHKIELTEENVNDYNISLNPENIQIISFKTHNQIHDRLGLQKQREVFLVYGSPLSGKSSWVQKNMSEGDLIVDIDRIWECISGCDEYVKPNRLKACVFDVRNTLYDIVKYRRGKWLNAFIVGGFPEFSERERLCREFDAKEIFIDIPKEECLRRLKDNPEGRGEEWKEYIEKWFTIYQRTTPLVP